MNILNIFFNQDLIVYKLFKGKIKCINGFIIVLMMFWDRLFVLFRKSWKFNVMIVSLQINEQMFIQIWGKKGLEEYVLQIDFVNLYRCK